MIKILTLLIFDLMIVESFSGISFSGEADEKPIIDPIKFQNLKRKCSEQALRADPTRKIGILWDDFEHLELGRAAGRNNEILFHGNQKVGIPLYTISFEEIVALADYYETFDDVMSEAQSTDGQQRLDFLRLKLCRKKYGDECAFREVTISKAEEEKINLRYWKITGNNANHFVEDNRAKKEYRRYHKYALSLAYLAGVSGNNDLYSKAFTNEAFGLHFYTDAFAAGHIRTPRQEIKSFYNKKHPRAFENFLQFVGSYLTEKILNDNSVTRYLKYTPLYVPVYIFVNIRVMWNLYDKTKDYKNTFSLGDVISLAIHDAEGNGLCVKSEYSSTGEKREYIWMTVGDGNLQYIRLGKIYIENAVKKSTQELKDAYDAGKKIEANKLAEIIDNISYDSEKFMPVALQMPDEPTFNNRYRWNTWESLNEELKRDIEYSVRKNIIPELEHIANSLPVESRTVFIKFIEEFGKHPLEFIEKGVYGGGPSSFTEFRDYMD